MSGSLLDQFASMREYERLGDIFTRCWYSIDQMAEDDGLSTASGERDTQSLLPFRKVIEHSLYAVFLIVAELDFLMAARGCRCVGISLAS